MLWLFAEMVVACVLSVQLGQIEQSPALLQLVEDPRETFAITVGLVMGITFVVLSFHAIRAGQLFMSKQE